MTTNATLIHKYVKLLVKYNFELLISLDGNEKIIAIDITETTKKFIP